MKKLFVLMFLLLFAACSSSEDNNKTDTQAKDVIEANDTVTTDGVNEAIEETAVQETATEETATEETVNEVAEDSTPVDTVEEATTNDTTDDVVSANDLSCVGNVTWNAPEKDSIDYTYTFLDLMSKAPVSGATVKVCALDDLECANPTVEGTTDADGKVTLTIPLGSSGLDGYLEITGDTIFPTLGFYYAKDNSVLYSSADSGPVYYLFSSSTVTLLTGMMGVTPDDTKGHLALAMNDCADKPGLNFTVKVDSADENTKTSYMVGGMPSATATGTDDSGQAAVINIPAGKSKVSSYSDIGSKVGEIEVIFRAGYITSMTLPPTPMD